MKTITIEVSDEFYAEYVGDFSVNKRGKINSPQALVHWIMQREARTQQQLRVMKRILTPMQQLEFIYRSLMAKWPEIWE